jgi:hypothetical protein
VLEDAPFEPDAGDVRAAEDAWAGRAPFGMTYFHVDHQGTPIARSDAWGGV